jgi:hypothetical protein
LPRRPEQLIPACHVKDAVEEFTPAVEIAQGSDPGIDLRAGRAQPSPAQAQQALHRLLGMALRLAFCLASRLAFCLASRLAFRLAFGQAFGKDVLLDP